MVQAFTYLACANGYYNGVYDVNEIKFVVHDGNFSKYSNMLPRFPKLDINGERIGGVSSLNFNADKAFDFGEFIFYFPGESSEISAPQQLMSCKIKLTLKIVRR